MEPAAVSTQSDRRPRLARSVWGPVAASAGMLVLGLVGGSVWWAARPSPAAEARAAAARGRVHLRQGRPDLAFQAVNQIRDESPEAGEAMAVAGLALVRMGQYRVARMALEHALKLKPDQFEAAVTLGELNLDLGNARRGADVLEMAARLRPGEFGVWRALGRALDDLNDTDGAAQAYQKALELRPADREITIQLIALLINSGQSGRAGPWIDQALQESPDDPVVLGLAARRAFDADRIDEALSLADRALRRDPRSPDATLARLRCLVARSRWREALAAAERVVVDMPNDLVVIRLLWTAQTRLGLTERAAATQARYDQVQKRTRQIVELTEDVNSHPDDPEIRWRLGQLALDGGSILAADRCFEAALAVDPDYRPARESLAALRASHPELARDPGPRARPGIMRPLVQTRPAQGATPASPAGHR